jgi:hypothetical protein
MGYKVSKKLYHAVTSAVNDDGETLLFVVTATVGDDCDIAFTRDWLMNDAFDRWPEGKGYCQHKIQFVNQIPDETILGCGWKKSWGVGQLMQIDMNRFSASCLASIGGAWIGGGLSDLFAVPKEYRGWCVLVGTIAMGLIGYFWLYNRGGVGKLTVRLSTDEGPSPGQPITVREMIAALQREDPDAIVVMAKDAEGNSYSPYRQLWAGAYQAETTWYGKAGPPALTDELRAEGYTEEDVFPDGVPAVILTPIN